MGDMKPTLTRRWNQICRWLWICVALWCFLFILVKSLLPHDNITSSYFRALGVEQRHSQAVLDSLDLDEEQCETSFPGLTKDIDDTIALGPFTLKQAGDGGPVQARIKNGQLYIIHSERKGFLSPELLDSRAAALHQIHRAITTSPSPLPDTIFAVNIQDQPFGTAWSYSRPAFAAPTANGPPITRAFLMPHFSFWNWPLPFIGSFSRAAAAIDAIEAALPFSKKDPRAVWRGTARFFGSHNPHLRQDLLSMTKGKAWADVEALKWEGEGNHTATNSLMVEDFCRYKYVLHTEGVTYSGRLQFLQMCGSVLLTPPLAWLQHTTHLIRPLFSCDLDLGNEERKRWTPSEGVQKAWPGHFAPEWANMVFVAPDWSDLEETVQWLEDHPRIAAGIAGAQRELFVGGGYFSPAAEACYWRALIRGWSKVVRTDGEGWEEKEGIRWESFALEHET